MINNMHKYYLYYLIWIYFYYLKSLNIVFNPYLETILSLNYYIYYFIDNLYINYSINSINHILISSILLNPRLYHYL
jgi:hypothetical protein